MKITININYEKIPGKQLDEKFLTEKFSEALNELLENAIPIKDVLGEKEVTEIVIDVGESK